MKVTLFADVFAKSKKEREFTWPELVAKLTTPQSYAKKSDAPLLKLATFGDRRTEKDSLRFDDNMLVITGIEGDYDGEIVTPMEAIDRLEKHGIRAGVYTSPSHTADKPRWRVLAPLSVDLPSGHRDMLIRRLNGALGGILTGESFTRSQTYYYGKVNGHPYECLSTFGDPDDGTCINELSDLDEIAAGPPKVSSTQTGEVPDDGDLRHAITSGDNYHEALCSLSARFAGRGMEAGDITATLYGLMDAAAVPHDERWTARRNEIPRLVADAVRKFQRDRKPVPDAQEPPDYVLEQIPVEALAEQSSSAPKSAALKHSTAKYSITIARDFQVRADMAYFIKGIWQQDTFGVTWGPSGGGKSFITADMVLHVVSGRNWCGRRVNHAGVVYLGAEGPLSMERRFIAMAGHAGLELSQLPLAILSGSLHMINDPGGIIAAIADAAHQLRAQFGVAHVMLVIDTLARSAPGMDENGPEDMGAYVGAVDRIRLELGMCVVVVHHAGKDILRGARGHGALKAAADCELMIADHRISIMKLRDGATGSEIDFNLHPVELAKDADGDPITTCRVEYTEAAQHTKQSKLPPTTQIAFEALREAIQAHGEALPSTSALPGGKPACDLTQWRNRFYARIADRNRDTQQKAFARAKDDLMARKFIGAWESRVWIW